MRAERWHEPRMGQPGFYPDRSEELRSEYRHTTPARRVSEAIALSRLASRLAVLGRKK